MKKTIITILVIILVAILGLIGYQCLNDNEEKIEINNGIYSVARGVINAENSTTSEEYIGVKKGNEEFVKLEKLNYMNDENKKDLELPYVYKIAPKYTTETFDYELNGNVNTIEYKQFRNEFEITEEETKDVWSVPYINLNFDGIDKINYILKAVCLNANANHDFAVFPHYCYYVTIKDDILSIGVELEASMTKTYKAFNIDLKNKTILSDEEFINKCNLTIDEVEKAIIQFAEECSFDSINEKEIAKEFFNEKNNEELLFGTKVDLNKNLNDFCKYDFTQQSCDDYAYIIKGNLTNPNGKNSICYIGDDILINKNHYDSLNNLYYIDSYEIKRTL